jgi:hypothetical protein
MENSLELAKGLQYSNEPSVAELAKAYITLMAHYNELKYHILKVQAELDYDPRAEE